MTSMQVNSTLVEERQPEPGERQPETAAKPRLKGNAAKGQTHERQLETDWSSAQWGSDGDRLGCRRDS